MHKDFNFDCATSIIPYLSELGVTTIYLSPIFKAQKGSTHGYDVVDPTKINPELGGERGFEKLVKETQNHNMNILLDIVPNHMAATLENPYWVDILENGQASTYSNFFDINWNSVFGPAENKLLLPILGKPFGITLENKEINISYKNGKFYFNYYDKNFPVETKSYTQILRFGIENFKELNNELLKKVLELIDKFNNLPPYTESSLEKKIERNKNSSELKIKLQELYENSEQFKNFIKNTLKKISGNKNNINSFIPLERILLSQPYQLVYWQAGLKEINFRRFFDVNELIGVKVENEDVMINTHKLLFELAEKHNIAGFRIDHIDGLYDPTNYLENLSKHTRKVKEDFHIVVEKILASHEHLPNQWKTNGTTGYEFLNMATFLLINKKGEKSINKLYKRIAPQNINFQELVYNCKKYILDKNFYSEITNLWLKLILLAKNHRHVLDFPLQSLRRLLEEVVVNFRVYRTYINNLEPSEIDKSEINYVIAQIKASNNNFEERGINFIKDLLTLNILDETKDRIGPDWLNFVMDLQQLSSPVMAKGFEDTALYNYNRLISLNEVGGNPTLFGITTDKFHDFFNKRQENEKGSLLTTSTHDTKRSEDVRCRINVLTEIPKSFLDHYNKWQKMNSKFKNKIGRSYFPDKNTEYLLYQTLIGSLPFELMREKGNINKEYIERIKNYMIKASREAKKYTNWIKPDENYENILLEFISKILNNNNFIDDLIPFTEKVAFYGAFNSLVYLTLKLTCPGIPDTYQGCDLWDFSLVDPDNRRPVDYQLRQKYLNTIKEVSEKEKILDLLNNYSDGSIKLYVSYKLLNLRKKYKELFVNSKYVPLKITGNFKNNFIAYMREKNNNKLVVILPRFITELTEPFNFIFDKKLNDTSIELPKSGQNKWTNIFLNKEANFISKKTPLPNLLADFPLGVFLQ
jgi:(1->4)-alpha-D-glucan 1-alpha-D-glucosylmutase